MGHTRCTTRFKQLSESIERTRLVTSRYLSGGREFLYFLVYCDWSRDERCKTNRGELNRVYLGPTIRIPNQPPGPGPVTFYLKELNNPQTSADFKLSAFYYVSLQS